ncbi:hypothetical protein ACFYTS_19530 [Nocardia sp. NPDC004151]|uniref:hypothetical protein n=1 Tax=Nocardia sp. NPDC004151 TaxID=3364304 RepID=UPI0036BBBC46
MAYRARQWGIAAGTTAAGATAAPSLVAVAKNGSDGGGGTSTGSLDKLVSTGSSK